MFTIICSFSGCSEKRKVENIPPPGAISQLENKYSKNFMGLKIPSKSKIKEEGLDIGLLKMPYKKVLEATIIVAMQKAPIVYFDRNNGILVAPPFSFYAEDGFQNGVRLYALLMTDLYKDADVPTRYLVDIHPDDQKRILQTTLGQIASQLQAAAKLEKGGRWSFLTQ